jgi:integrase
MSLYRRPNSKKWWCRFTAPNGAEIRRSTGTDDKRQAQEYADRLKAALWRIHRLGDKPRRTWQEAVVRWVAAHQHKATLDDDLQRLRWLNPHLGSLYLDEITRSRCETVAEAKAREGVAPATVNQYLQVIRVILRFAEQEWDWLDKAPRLRFRPVPKHRIRWLTRDEADRLLAALPEHLAAMVRFTLATGLRAANVTGLTWSQVDLSRRVAWVHADEAKDGVALNVPLNDEAVLVLRKELGKHPSRVFTFEGEPVGHPNGKAWRKALDRAGIRPYHGKEASSRYPTQERYKYDDFRWHDLRHTWASWHVMAGTPLEALMELAGWDDYTMARRYAHLAPAHVAQYAQNVNRGLHLVRTVSGTPAGRK